MSDYTGTHSRASNLVERKGISVTFTLDSTTVSGFAVQDTGAFREYFAQGLVTAQDEVVFFIPSTIGECPKEGYTLSGFTDVEMVTKRVFPLAPNGTIIGARVVVSR